MALFRNPYEKRLDKSLQSWYNTRKKERVMELKIEELIKHKSTNADRSKLNLEYLKIMGNAIRKVGSSERYANIRTPVIAGGAVRDTVYGLMPKDWDIFFDLSTVSDDHEDFTLLYLADLLEEMRKDPVLGPRLTDTRTEALEGSYVNPEGQKSESWEEAKQFVVYQNGWSHPEAEYPEDPIYLQTIGRKDSRLTDDPVSFLSDFDYCAVKCLYDPSTDSFGFHEDFQQLLKDNVITYSDDKTMTRVHSFNNRFWGASPFKLVDTRPNKSPNKKVKVKTTTTTLEALNRQIEAHMGRAINLLNEGNVIRVDDMDFRVVVGD